MVQFHYPVFDVCASAIVDFIYMPQRVLEVRHYEARVVFGFTPEISHDIGLD